MTQHQHQSQHIENGDKVRDKLTGFEGVVIGITDWLYQCRRPIVQPTGLDKDGAIAKSESFDEDQLVIVEKGVFAIKRPAPEQVTLPPVAEEPALEEPELTTPVRTGGPRDTPTRRADPTRR